MARRNICFIVLFLLLVTACGPETIFVRPNLDSPERHVANGRALFDQNKFEDALREFKRANELDPKSLDALIGLGVTMGHCGNPEQGLPFLVKAEKLAATKKEEAKVQDGFAQLRKLQTNR